MLDNEIADPAGLLLKLLPELLVKDVIEKGLHVVGNFRLIAIAAVLRGEHNDKILAFFADFNRILRGSAICCRHDRFFVVNLFV
nr:hypothetical protein [Geobacter hydrogenophilus]